MLKFAVLTLRFPNLSKGLAVAVSIGAYTFMECSAIEGFGVTDIIDRAARCALEQSNAVGGAKKCKYL
jgi:hypothetical protein